MNAAEGVVMNEKQISLFGLTLKFTLEPFILLVNHPEKRWLNWLLGILFVLVLLMSIMGFFAASASV
jgi:hypothetical protein